MVKNVIICTLFLALIASILFGLNRASRIDSATKASILAQQERDRARQAESEARESLKSVRDSLDIAYVVASNARIDVNRAKIETVKAQKALQEVVFKSYQMDKERDSVLRVLYPSLK